MCTFCLAWACKPSESECVQASWILTDVLSLSLHRHDKWIGIATLIVHALRSRTVGHYLNSFCIYRGILQALKLRVERIIWNNRISQSLLRNHQLRLLSSSVQFAEFLTMAATSAMALSSGSAVAAPANRLSSSVAFGSSGVQNLAAVVRPSAKASCKIGAARASLNDEVITWLSLHATFILGLFAYVLFHCCSRHEILLLPNVAHAKNLGFVGPLHCLFSLHWLICRSEAQPSHRCLWQL